jgi:hypothetical protein
MRQQTAARAHLEALLELLEMLQPLRVEIVCAAHRTARRRTLI